MRNNENLSLGVVPAKFSAGGNGCFAGGEGARRYSLGAWARLALVGLCPIHEEGTNVTRPDCASDRAASLRKTAFVWYLANREQMMSC
jgi:hypothetical protein